MNGAGREVALSIDTLHAPRSRQIARCPLCWLLMMTTLIARAAGAQSTPLDLADVSLEDLMQMTVTTASRTAESLAEAPARIRVVTAAQIQQRGYRSLTDVFKDVAEFTVDTRGEQDTPTELIVQGIRGANRIIILLDGIRISSPTNDPLPIVANYPVHSAQQIEILYGPASALYGADAFSAIVNIISKKGADAAGLSGEVSAGQHGLYNYAGLFGTRFGADGTLTIGGQLQQNAQPNLDRFYPDVFQGLQEQRSGTFNTDAGPLSPTPPYSSTYSIPLSAHSLQAALTWRGLTLLLFQNAVRASNAPPFAPDSAVYTPDAFDQNSLWVTSASYTHPIGAVTTTSTLTFSRQALNPQSGDRNVDTELNKGFIYADGSMAKAEAQLTWLAGHGISLTTGGTFERFFAIPEGADLNAPIQTQRVPGTIYGTTIPDAFIKLHYTNTGGYAQVQYVKSPRLHLTIGGRVDDNSRFGATLNPRIGVVSRFAASTTLKLLYGTAYLAPSPFEQYAHSGQFRSTDRGVTYTSLEWHLPNPQLKPQRKQTVEAELQHTVGRGVLLTTSTFYSRFADLIAQSDPDLTHPGLYLGWPVAAIESPVRLEGDAGRHDPEGHRVDPGRTARLPATA